MKGNMIESEFCCKREGLIIRGREFRPEGKNLPIMIASHGFGGNLRHMIHYCETFASWGYAAYCFDFCGGCTDGTSDGTSLDMTIQTECHDLRAVMDYAISLPYTDEGNLVLFGCSQGGFVSALTAAYHPKDVKALILLYPALCIPDDARNGSLARSSYNINNVPKIIDCGQMKLSSKFHESVVHMNPFEEIKAFHGPVLLLHGTSDQLVNFNYAIKAKESYAKDQCHLKLIKEAGHSFTEKQTQSAIVSIRQFLSAN